MAGKALTLLEQFEAQAALEDAKKKQKASGTDAPTTNNRVIQGAIGLFGVQIAAGILTAGFVFCLVLMEIEPASIPTKEPFIYLLGGLLIPCLAVLLAVPLCLRGVFLAQLLGAGVGGAGAILLMLERIYYGIGPSWIEWILTPPAAAAIGFVAGLRVAGDLLVAPKFEFKPLDTWDREAKMKVKELDVHLMERIKRVSLAVVAGVVGGGIAYTLMVKLLMPMYHYNESSVGAVLSQVRLPFACLVAFLAGSIAGAGTKTGATQGLFCGLGLFAISYLWNRPIETNEILFMAARDVVPAIFGGLAGRFVFPPSRVLAGELDGVG